MNTAYKFDEYGNVMMPSRNQNYPRHQASHSDPGQWRGPRASPPSFPPLDMIGNDNSYNRRNAPMMDRIANRSRSPYNGDRRPENYRSRTPPQQDSSYDRRPRPQISYPRPFVPEREESPPRFALRGETPPQFQQRQALPSQQLPYPPEDRIPPRPQLRVSPVPRQAPAPREIPPSRPQRPVHPLEQESQSTLNPISETSQDVVPNPRANLQNFQTGMRLDLIPKPLNFKQAPSSRKDVTSICEYLSLDELENMWHDQDMYSGTITAPVAAKPCRSPLGFGMAPVGSMSPSLADHPAFRNDRMAFDNSVRV